MRPILFADNDPDFLETRSEFLEKAGYEIVKATSPAEAEGCLREAWTPVAILDIRLENDDDDKDTSGLALADADFTRSVTKIILTNFKTPLVRDLVRAGQRGRPLAIDIVEKQEGPDALLRVIHEALTYHVRINFSLPLDWRATSVFDLVSRIEPSVESERERLLNRAEELEDLFRRLFYENDRVHIDRVLWRRDARVALAVSAFKGAMENPFIVVCGQNARVTEEVNRYNNVAPKAHGETSTTLADKAETTHFAANAYSLGQTDLETIRSLREVYRAGDKKVFTQAVETLFEKTLTAWQGSPVPAERALEELYRERLGLTTERISPQAVHARWQTLVRYIPELKNILPDPGPIIALLKAGEQATQIVKSPGMLTGDNILVDANGRAWLTDFADAGDVPQFWNFVTLESAIRFDWLEEKELLRLRELEKCLLDDNHFGKPDSQDVESAVAKQAVRAIYPLRRLAARAMGKEYWQYHLGIFFHAARRLADFDPAVPPKSHQRVRLAHVLMAMALIAAKVEQVGRQATTSSERGLRVDKDGVKRDGKRIAVRGQSRALLNYLADHCEHTCSARELIENVLQDKFDRTDKHQIGRLQTAIRRLREKIEYDPEHPRFLLTEAEGYRLVLQPDE